MKTFTLPPSLGGMISRKSPLLWINECWRPIAETSSGASISLVQVYEAEESCKQFGTLLSELFPELLSTGGIIESPLLKAQRLQKALGGDQEPLGRWFIKGDHLLPVAGSIKARGGIFEVLKHAEDLLLRHGLMRSEDNRTVMASAPARAFFFRHKVAVGSTGNLGLSIGLIASALGFRATVHMSSDAKSWKKQRLRARDVEVIEHCGDFGVAVAAGRAQAKDDTATYFVDDENSPRLFLGYSVAALRLKHQLVAEGVTVDAQHPLFVYIPCGVGGAPGGITFGLRHLFGDHVHCFLGEPVASPSMLIRLASHANVPISVKDFGLDNRTEADGLAVGQASEFVAQIVKPLVSGIFTVSDHELFADLFLLNRTEGLRIEPSAAAGFRGPGWLMTSAAGRQYLLEHGLLDHLRQATHVLWVTGGALVPDEEYQGFYERGFRESELSPSNPLRPDGNHQIRYL
jgi:D-serine dehydratase